MNVGKSITKAIDEMELRDNESAMLHACNAVDGTAAKVYPSLGSNVRFTTLLRDNYDILGPMSLPGINLFETRFPIPVQRPKAAGGQSLLAMIAQELERSEHARGAAQTKCGSERP